MKGLLAVEHATKRYRRGRLEHVAIRDVSLEMQAGEMVAVWGPRRSGRSTLLRIAAGLEFPEEGRVIFEGKDLATCRDKVLGRQIGYCQKPPDGRALVVEHVAAGLLAQRDAPRQARRRAETALARVGADGCARLECHELDGAEAVRVSVATALVSVPALLVIDEPTNGVELLDRDPLLAMLRSIANDGVGVLLSAADAQSLSGVDRALSLNRGELRGELSAREGDVIPLSRTAPTASRARSGTDAQ